MVIGKIYKIISGQGEECYIGSTFDELRYRFRGHKSHYDLWKQGKHNNVSVYDLFEKYGVDECKCILIKEYDVIDRKHLEVYETLWINKLKKTCVNKLHPFFIKKLYKKQYFMNNKDNIYIKQKRYLEENKESINEYRKQYYENNKNNVRIRCQKYYEQNKEIIKEKVKNYRKNNKEMCNNQRRTYRNEKIICECGKQVSRSYIYEHKKTQKHQKYFSDKK